MITIPECLVSKTHKEVADFSIEQAHSGMTGVSEIQPNLVAFILEFTKDQKPDVAELAMYCFFVVFRMFQKGAGKPIEQVTHKTIVDCYESNETLIESLENTHQRFFERVASVQLLDQPHVMKYIVDALFEGSQEGEDLDLSEEDTGYLFILLKTVVDALNKTINA
jgi:hypothetical protein